MSTVYFQDAASSDLNLNTVSAPANSCKLPQTAAGSASSVTITLPSAGSLLEHWFIAEPGDPGASGGSGAQTFTVKVNVTTANMNLSAPNQTFEVARLNSAGVVQASAHFAGTTSWPQTAQVWSFTGSLNLGTFAAGDRLGLRFILSNGSMSSQSCVIEVGLANGNEEVDAPWTIAGGTTNPLTLTATSTTVPLLARLPKKALNVTATGTATRIASMVKTWAVSSTATASRLARTAKTWAVGSTTSTTVVASRVFLKTLSALGTSTAVVTRQAGKALAATTTGAATATRTTLRALVSLATGTGSVTRRIGHATIATVTGTPSVVRASARSLAAMVTGSAVVSTVKVKLLTLAVSVSSAPVIQRAVGARRAVTTTAAVSAQRVVMVARSAGSTTSAAIFRSVRISRAATASATATVGKFIGAIRSAVTTVVAAIQAILPGGGASPDVDPPTFLVLAGHRTTAAVRVAATSMAEAAHPTTGALASHPTTLSLDG